MSRRFLKEKTLLSVWDIKAQQVQIEPFEYHLAIEKEIFSNPRRKSFFLKCSLLQSELLVVD